MALLKLFMALLTLTFAFSAALSSVDSRTLPTTVFIRSSSFCMAFNASIAASVAAALILLPVPPFAALPSETLSSFCWISAASSVFTCPFSVLVSLATRFRSLVIWAVSSASLLSSRAFLILSRELLILLMEVSMLLLKLPRVSLVEDRS